MPLNASDAIRSMMHATSDGLLCKNAIHSCVMSSVVNAPLKLGILPCPTSSKAGLYHVHIAGQRDVCSIEWSSAAAGSLFKACYESDADIHKDICRDRCSGADEAQGSSCSVPWQEALHKADAQL